jgi:hypothetical protein
VNVADGVPGKLEVPQRYNDEWRGWPVFPLHRQHPIRGSFLDPRAHDRLGAVYHNGVDIAVRDDLPGRGAPAGRTHRVHAIEGGQVIRATSPGVRGLVDIAHFRYEHVDVLVRAGDVVRPGQHIAWAWKGDWHVHLSEFVDLPDGRRVFINPLRSSRKLAPYVDTGKPLIEEVRCYVPATPAWGRRPANVARYPQAGRRLDKRRLSGAVDVRARIADPQSFIGWFKDKPWLAAPHHPFRVAVSVARHGTGVVFHHGEVFRAEQLLEQPAGQHYAPGTEQNLPAGACVRRHASLRCQGSYWFRLFPPPYLNTRLLPNGRYRISVRVWDAAGNFRVDNTDVKVIN